MELKTFFAQDETGQVVSGAIARVYLPGTTELATGLQDRFGKTLKNPFTADNNGQIQFRAPNGNYDLHVSFGVRTYTIPVKFLDVEDIGTLGIETVSGPQSLCAALNQRTIYVDGLADLQTLDAGQLVEGQAAVVGRGSSQGEHVWDAQAGLWLSMSRAAHIHAYAHYITDRSDPDPENWYWDEAFAALLAENDTFYTPSKTFRMRRSLAFGKRVLWFADQTALRFDANGDYNEIMHRPAGVAFDQYVGTGKYVALDSTGSVNTRIVGALTLKTDVDVSDMTLARRQGFNPHLVAYGASVYPGGYEITIDTLDLYGWGYAFYQGDFREPGPKILPYTRLNIKFLRIQRCLHILRTGKGGNGFDDAWIDCMRTSRCVGKSELNATDLNVGSWFYCGLVDADKEPGQVTCTADSATAVLTTKKSLLTAGMYIVIESAGKNKAGNPIPHVSYISAKRGNTLILETPPEVSGIFDYWADPGSFLLSSADLSGIHIYPEYIFRSAFVLEANAGIDCRNFKVSNGLCSGLLGATILTIGLSASVNINLNHVTGFGLKTIVGFGMLRRNKDQLDAGITCRINTSRQKSDILDNKEVFSCVKLPVSAYVAGFYVDRSAYTMRSVNAEANFCGSTVRYKGQRGTVETYEKDSLGISDLAVNGGRVFSGTKNVDISSINTPIEILNMNDLEFSGVYLVHVKHPSAENNASAFVVVRMDETCDVSPLHEKNGTFSTTSGNLEYRVNSSTGIHNVVFLRLA